MSQKNLDVQARSAQLEKLHNLVAFFETQIGENLEKRNFQLARSWYASLSGAYLLAELLGLEEPDHKAREGAWFQRIQTAQFGPGEE